MDRMTQKTSTVLISVGDETQVFRSVAEVPPRLRRRLLESTSGANSVTLLIADEQGRREILRSLQGEGSPLESRLLAAVVERARRDRGRRVWSWRHWVEVALIGGIGLCLWLLASWK